MPKVAEQTRLTKKHTPPDWVETGRSDYHVAVYLTNEPNCLIFAPLYNTIDLLDDCMWSATMEGKQLTLIGECTAYEIRKVVDGWPHVTLKWIPNV
jgi:hypothetical protein